MDVSEAGASGLSQVLTFRSVLGLPGTSVLHLGGDCRFPGESPGEAHLVSIFRVGMRAGPCTSSQGLGISLQLLVSTQSEEGRKLLFAEGCR